MLPDFPKVKEKFLSKLNNRFEKRSKQQAGPFGELQAKPICEGHNWRMERADGSVDLDPLAKSEVKIEIKVSEIETLSLQQILQKFDLAADEMSQKMSEHFYKKLSRITDEAGNVVNAKGKPFSIDQYFKVLRKMEFDFGPNGEPELPTVIVHPKKLDRTKKVLSEIELNPEYKAQYEEIIEKKRQAWRARENSRKLVG